MTYYGFGHGVGMSQCGAVGYAQEQGMGYREIAKVLGRDGKSTDNALQRSRGKLRRALDKKTEQEKEVLRTSKGEE